MSLIEKLTGNRPRPHLLMTDWYKFRMAEIGAPLRKETFVFSIRKKGPHYVTFDSREFVNSLLPDSRTETEARQYVEQEMGLKLTEAAWTGLRMSVQVCGVPRDSWVANGEPVLTVTGPQILVSWLEALLIGQGIFLINVATIIMRDGPDEIQRRLSKVAVEREAEIIRILYRHLKGSDVPFEVEVATREYHNHVSDKARDLMGLVGNDPKRVVESGFRACSCTEAHEVAVRAAKDAGFTATSSVYLAWKLGMTPFGTTGHEHTSRCGDDYTAFSDAVDRTDKPTTMLLDTYSTIHSGIPSAIEVLHRRPHRKLSVRLDSESTMVKDYLFLTQVLREKHTMDGDTPSFTMPLVALGGGFGFDETSKFEDLRVQIRWPANLQAYQYGQYLNEQPWPLPSRGDVGAVYKLSWVDGTPRRKFSDNKAKSSLAGQPVVWRLTHPDGAGRYHMPLSIIGQAGEDPEPGYICISGLPVTPYQCLLTHEDLKTRIREIPTRLSAATQALHDALGEQRLEFINKAVGFEVNRDR